MFIEAGNYAFMSNESYKYCMEGDCMSELLGRRLRALRRLKRLTQQDLAREVGISVSLLSTIERGMKYPQLDLIKRFARVLDVPLEELFVLPESVQ